MSINVVCPGCHTRFKVSDKFAGKSGACPKCKGKIEVPSAKDQVVIHEREFEAGAKDAQGRNVLKPVARKDTKLNPVILVAVVGLVILVLVAAFMLRGQEEISPLILAAGAFLLALPTSWGGYFFLRDDELEGFRGLELLVRTLACAVAYAGVWGLYVYLCQLLGWTNPDDLYFYAVMLGVMLPLGAGVAFVCYDLEPGNAFFHYAFYLIVTALLRLLIGLPLLGPA